MVFSVAFLQTKSAANWVRYRTDWNAFSWVLFDRAFSAFEGWYMDAQVPGPLTGLPKQGQAVEFVLDDRDVAMLGTYDRQMFRSRWSEYAINRVRTWRSACTDAFIPAATHVAGA